MNSITENRFRVFGIRKYLLGKLSRFQREPIIDMIQFKIHIASYRNDWKQRLRKQWHKKETNKKQKYEIHLFIQPNVIDCNKIRLIIPIRLQRKRYLLIIRGQERMNSNEILLWNLDQICMNNVRLNAYAIFPMPDY